MGGIMSSRRARLVGLLLVATAAISVLAFRAAGTSVSYYITPAEFMESTHLQTARVRVAGRVVEGSVVEQAGRPIAFTIEGDASDRVQVDYPEGVVPNLFGPWALVVVEGTGRGAGLVEADSILIKHENEFYAGDPPAGSISARFVRPDETSGGPPGIAPEGPPAGTPAP